MKRLAVLLLAASLAGSGCTRTTQSPTPCGSPAEAVLPGSVGTLDESSSGSYCLAVGQTLDVFLHAPAPAQRWTPVASSRPDLLAPQSSSALTAPVGVTPGIFRAEATGTAQLSSTRPNGPSWSVTVVIR